MYQTIMENKRLWVSLILICLMFVAFAIGEFSFWSPERYSILKSIPNEMAVFFLVIGLAITYFAYLYAKNKGWWGLDSKNVKEEI